jgi:hypothetical protein
LLFFRKIARSWHLQETNFHDLKELRYHARSAFYTKSVFWKCSKCRAWGPKSPPPLIGVKNEDPACRKTRQTSLQSILPKDVMTSLLSLLTSNRRKICVQFSAGFWQKKTLSEWASCGISWETLVRYRHLCVNARNPSKSLEDETFGMIDASTA